MKVPFIPEQHEKCNGKNCYRDKAEAEVVAEEQEILDFAGELELKVYKCGECGQWHLSRRKA